MRSDEHNCMWFSLYRGCTNKTKRRGNKIQIFLPDTIFACARGRVWIPLPRFNYTPDQTDSKHGYHDVNLWSSSLLAWWIAVWQGFLEEGGRWKYWSGQLNVNSKESCIRNMQLWTKQNVDRGQLWIILLPYCVVSWQCDKWELPLRECLYASLNSKLLLFFLLI